MSRSFSHSLFLLALLAVATPMVSMAATLEQETVTRLDQIRAMKPGQGGAVLETYNRQMDATWKFYTSHQPQIFSILRAQLKAEIARDRPSDLVLLDTAVFLHDNDTAEGKTVARDALFRLDPSAAIVHENLKGLFDLTHAAAEDRDDRVLEFIDNNFLPTKESIFVPQHSLKLEGTLMCVFLYGAYGSDAEPHLRSKLADPTNSERVLEILGWLGTPDSLSEVGKALDIKHNYETLARVTSFMMQVGGPAGRAFMLKLDSAKLDPSSRDYLAKILPAIQAVSFDAIRSSLTKAPGDKVLSDKEMTLRLDAMIANYGQDDRTSPLAVLDSGLSAEVLISQLLKVRSKALYRLSDEALSDVEATNTVINGLRYRGH